MWLSLLAEAVTVSPLVLGLIGLLLTAGGILVGVAVTWGSMKTTVSQLQSVVKDLSGKVEELHAEIGKLSREVAVLQDRDARESRTEPAGRNRAARG
jgi:outer membrane murein-binding lipoprotein Lpp